MFEAECLTNRPQRMMNPKKFSRSFRFEMFLLPPSVRALLSNLLKMPHSTAFLSTEEYGEYADILEYAEFSTVPSSSSMSADVLVGSPSVLLLPRNITGSKTAPTTATEATAEVTIVLIFIFFAGGIVPLTMTPVTSDISDNQ